jgi:hypothetical protein
MPYSEQDKKDKSVVADLQEVVRRVEATGSFRIRITQGTTPSVSVFGRDIDKNQIDFELVGGTLKLDNGGKWTWKEDQRTVFVEIVTPEILSIEISGASEAEVGGFYDGPLDVELNGSSRLFFSGSLSNLTLEANGASEAELVGNGKKIEAELRGASRLQASDYKAEEVNLEAHGACTAEVWAQERLDISATGVSSVNYKGDAQDVEFSQSGIAKINKTKELQ